MASSIDEPIVTFIYESALNSFEHGRIDEHEKLINGVRGFVVEKLQFAKSEAIEKRHGFPDLIKQYLKAIWPDLEGSRYQCISLTVTDLGKGIHNTLESIEKESDWQKLNRAFTEGATRKSPAADTRRGLGLPKVLESCQHLRAFLFVASSNLLGYRDFSKDTPQEGKGILIPWPTLGDYKNVGTTLTILFPLTQGHMLQPNLFPDDRDLS